jgi:hypothetical protein
MSRCRMLSSSGAAAHPQPALKAGTLRTRQGHMVDDLSDMLIGVLCSTTVKLCLHTSVLIAGPAVHMHTTAPTRLSTSQHSHLAPEVLAELWVGFQETPGHWLTPVLQLKEPKAIVSSLYRALPNNPAGQSR